MGGYLVYLNDIAPPLLLYVMSFYENLHRQHYNLHLSLHCLPRSRLRRLDVLLSTLTLTQSNLAIVYFYMKKEPFSVRLSPREYRVVVVLC